MAVSKRTLSFTSGLKQIRDITANATAENDVNSGASTLYGVRVDNSANSAASFLKLYNNAAPTVGTTVPDFVLRVNAGKTKHVLIPKGISFATAISEACVTAGGTGGTTNPTSAVIVDLLVV